MLRGPLHGHYTAPRCAVILLIVDGEAGADFGGRFEERDLQHHRAFELLLGWPGNLLPASANHMIYERAHGGQLGGFALDGLGLAEDHNAAIVHRVAGRRRGEDDAVEQRNREAERRAGCEGAHQAAGG